MKYIFKHMGDIPVVLSVPHGGMEEPTDFIIRKSGNLRVDMFTMDLALELESALGAEWGQPYLAAGLLRRCIVDYNRPPGEAFEDPGADPHYLDFHRALGECVDRARQQSGTCLLLDIHGRAGRGPGQPQVVLGTGNYSSMGPDMVRGICNLISLQGLSNRHDTSGQYRGGYIVRKYCDGRGICGVQLEISREVRESGDGRRAFALLLSRALTAFAGCFLLQAGR